MKHRAQVGSLMAALRLSSFAQRLVKGTSLLFGTTPSQAPAFIKGSRRPSRWALPLLLLDWEKT